MSWPSRPVIPGRDKVSASWASRSGSAIRVKQLPAFARSMPAAAARQVTYSWPLRMAWALNGGCPLNPDPRLWKRVVIDVLTLLLQVTDYPGGGPADFPNRRRRLAGQDQEHAPAQARMLCQVLLGDQILVLSGLADDNRHLVGPRPARTRRAKRPAIRIRCVSSSRASPRRATCATRSGSRRDCSRAGSARSTRSCPHSRSCQPTGHHSAQRIRLPPPHGKPAPITATSAAPKGGHRRRAKSLISSRSMPT